MIRTFAARFVLVGALLCAAVPAAAFDITLLATDTAGFIGQAATGPLDTPVRVTSYAQFTATFGTTTAGLDNPWLAPSVAAFFANGGSAAIIVRVATNDRVDLIGADFGGGVRTGLFALAGVDSVAVLAAPGVGDPAVQAAMISQCRHLGDRIAVLDPAVPGDLAAVQDQRADLPASDGHAALYFPWVEAAPTGTPLTMPPSGFVAGVMCATSPADSPVDLLAGATGLAYPVGTAETDLLNPQGINAIRDLSGVRIWGARTLSSDPEWRYIAVRRTHDVIRESVYEGTRLAIFEPNDANVWSQLQSDTQDFLLQLFQAGWFAGASPSDAYAASCGLGLSMTQADVDAGLMIIRFAFAPLRPAEFVVGEVVQRWPWPSPVPEPAAAGGLTLAPPAPNPCNPRTVVRFTLADPATAAVGVYDAAGRRVRALAPATFRNAGEHRLVWDGNDDAGRGVASGVYFVRVEGGAGAAQRPVTLVR